jgi:hypothetical protein
MSIFSQNTASIKSSFIVSSNSQSITLLTNVTDLILVLKSLGGTSPIQSVQTITDYINLLKKESTSSIYINIIKMLITLRDLFISFFPISDETFQDMTLVTSTYLDLTYEYRQYIATGDKNYLSDIDTNILPLVIQILDGIKNNTVN